MPTRRSATRSTASGMAGAARRELARALRLDPHLHEARIYLGHLLYERGRVRSRAPALRARPDRPSTGTRWRSGASRAEAVARRAASRPPAPGRVGGAARGARGRARPDRRSSWPRSREARLEPEEAERARRRAGCAARPASRPPTGRPDVRTAPGWTLSASSATRAACPASPLHSSCGARPTGVRARRGSASRVTSPRRSSGPARAPGCCASNADRMIDPSRVLQPSRRGGARDHGWRITVPPSSSARRPGGVARGRALAAPAPPLRPRRPDALRLAALSPQTCPPIA